jgi:hypothetical protein
MKLSPDVRRVWRRFSFQAMGWALAGLAAWPNLPPEFQAVITPRIAVWVLGVLLVLGMAGSCIDQPKTKVNKEPPQ